MSERKRSTRAKPGDIGRVQVDETLWAKLQYLGPHETFGHAVLVDPNLTSDAGEGVSGHLLKSYVVFYLFPAFVKDRLVEIVDHQPPQLPVPAITRMPQVVGKRPCRSWIFVHPTGQRVVRDTLTDEELDIPESLILSHATLLHRLKTGWQPSDNVVREGQN